MRHRHLSVAASIASCLAASYLLAACNGPRAIHETPVLVTGERVASIDSAIDAARADRARAEVQLRRQQDSVRAVATADCTPAVCAAIARGEVVVGMSAPQVFAASASVPSAWRSAAQGRTLVLSPASLDAMPHDVYGRLAALQLVDGRVQTVTRVGRTGETVVTASSDTSTAARTRALADALVREGDDYVAAGDRARALERYDRALVLRSDDPLLTYRVAQLLDQQLRPLEALMRYQKFLLQMELQRIDAQGTQNAKLAEAIALAQQRVLVLDRRGR